MYPEQAKSIASSEPPGVELPAAMGMSEFCRWACIGKTKAYAEVKDGRLPVRKIGNKTIVLRSDAERWLHALPRLASVAEA
jgi:hypothetical protein